MKTMKQYIPILRWRAAEVSALEKLYGNDRKSITPLIEFIMPAPTTDKDNRRKVLEDSKTKFLRKLPEIGKQLKTCCEEGSVFIDTHLLDGDIRATVFEKILSSSKALGLNSIPVIYIIPPNGTNANMLTRKTAIEYAKINHTGICIRIDISHFDENLSSHIKDFMRTNGLTFENTDILVDTQIVDKSVSKESIIKKLETIPHLEKWRSFILSGGAFPKDLSALDKHEHHKKERLEWKLWKDIKNKKKTKREILFSDYTIQHPIHYALEPGFKNVSASIRYTNDEVWEIIRGEGLQNPNGAGHKQYIAHAREIIKQPFYKGEKYSYGDKYISEKASPKNIKSGNPKTWLTAGINHHLTLAARQISNLP